MAMTIPEMIAVLQAAQEGKTIQCRHRHAAPDAAWMTDLAPTYDFERWNYRVMPPLWEGWLNEYPRWPAASQHLYDTPLYGTPMAAKAAAGLDCIRQVHMREVVDE